MTHDDADYICRLLAAKMVVGPVLELGAMYPNLTSHEHVKAAGLQYFGTDLEPGPLVQFVANFEKSEDMDVFRSATPFGSVFILNVLEHTFDPIRVLDNARTLVKPGGKLVLLTPAIWPLHNYPMDTWRIMPNFYEEYSRRRGLKLEEAFFEYVGFGTVQTIRDADGSYRFPVACQCQSPWRYWYGRLVHRAFHTYARSMSLPSHVAIAAVLTVPNSRND